MLSHRAAAPLWSLLIVVLCLIPGQDVPKVDIVGVDKIAHFALFAVFAIVWRRRARPAGLFIILLSGLLLAVGTEILQGALSWGRQPDPFDVLANTLGLVVGLAIAKWAISDQ